MLEDITDRKQTEKEREKLICELQQMTTEMDSFNHTISHDLRGPLVTIKGLLGLLKTKLENHEQDNTIAKALDSINSVVDKMHDLLRDLMELSKIGQVVNPKEQIPLAEIAHDAVDLLAGTIEETSAEIRFDTQLPSAYIDRVRMRQVFQNLIENAIKYAKAQISPIIIVGVREEKDEQVFFVQDNGIGLDIKHADRIFGLFHQLDPAQKGTGAGLALVKKIIEAHSGRIWVESEGLGKGCTFCFTLPGKNFTSPEVYS